MKKNMTSMTSKSMIRVDLDMVAMAEWRRAHGSCEERGEGGCRRELNGPLRLGTVPDLIRVPGHSAPTGGPRSTGDLTVT